MLPQFYRFIAYNDTGQTLTYNNNGRLNVKMTGVKWDDTNKYFDYTQLSDDDCGFGAGDSTADGAEDKTSEIDNTTNRYDFLQVQLEVTHDEGAAVVAGEAYRLYIDGGDATGELASDAAGYNDALTNKLELVGTLVFTSDADDELFRSPVWEV